MRNFIPGVKRSARNDNTEMTDHHPTIRWSDAIRFWTVGAIAMFTCMMTMMAVRMFFKVLKKSLSKIIR